VREVNNLATSVRRLSSQFGINFSQPNSPPRSVTEIASLLTSFFTQKNMRDYMRLLPVIGLGSF
jgi:hypothetical protein